jgi:hypothetical protein
MWTLKKKEQKRAGSILADFLKNIFFSSFTFCMIFFDTRTEKHETFFFVHNSHVVASEFYGIDSYDPKVNALLF